MNANFNKTLRLWTSISVLRRMIFFCFTACLATMTIGCGENEKQATERRKAEASERITAALEKGPTISRYKVSDSEISMIYIPSRNPRLDTLDYSLCILIKDTKSGSSTMDCREIF